MSDERPETMADMIYTLARAAAESSHKVVPTLATRNLSDLPSGTRRHFETAMIATHASFMGLGMLTTGQTITQESQTDYFYKTNDIDSSFRRLSNILTTEARRIR